jgi:hypothetical protein
MSNVVEEKTNFLFMQCPKLLTSFHFLSPLLENM